AIPRTAEAVLTLPQENVEDLKELCDYCRKQFADEYHGVEPNIEVSLEQVELPATEVPVEIQDNLISAIVACHNGVLRFIPSMPSVVETSSNLAIINIGGGNASISILARSSCETQLEFLQEMMECTFGMAGMKVEFSGRYGSWQPDFDSPVVARMTEVYRKCFGEEARVEVCHAGLECSIIGAVYPNMELVSFGPTLRSPHTPDERCNIPSVEKFWTFLKALLASL
ncbi:MAG: M20/M25/M40 family metallo-hydrolase, partial [Bacteroidaceae bacterium]|nr:M20/M25/M40 family metallo-hydrolase [Bacteroidaceae bacterium]